MFATRKTRLAAICLLLTALAACDRKHDSNDFLPSSPEFQKALQIVLEALSVPADGASTVRIEAQISPDADQDKRTVRFETTLGSWVDPDPEPAPAGVGGQANTAAAGQTATREADTQGKAVAFLKSAAEAGVAVITVSVIDDSKKVLATVSGEVTFTQISDALELTVDPTEVFADGTSVVNLEAQISADSPAAWKTVKFETTLGSLNGQTADATTKKSEPVSIPTDGDRIARARLTSATVGTASVKATIVEFSGASVAQAVTFTPAPSPAISLTPESWDFDEVALGESSEKAFTIGNHGTAPLTVENWVVTGTGFAISEAPARPATIQPASSVQITVRFSPGGAAEVKNGELTITSNAPGDPLKATLTGTAVAAPTAQPMIVVPASLEFGEVKKTDVSKTLTLTIRNDGDATLKVTKVENPTGSAKFTLVGAPAGAFQIPAKGTFDVAVKYTPTANSADSETLIITSEDPLNPVKNVSLSGSGTEFP